jgi:hypothetical protein
MMNNNMKEVDEDVPFTTTDMDLVTVLLEVGHKLKDIDKSPMRGKRQGPSRILFRFDQGTTRAKRYIGGKVIEEDRSLKETLIMYANDEILVPARKLLNRLRDVKSMISNANVTDRSLTGAIYDES